MFLFSWIKNEENFNVFQLPSDEYHRFSVLTRIPPRVSKVIRQKPLITLGNITEETHMPGYLPVSARAV